MIETIPSVRPDTTPAGLTVAVEFAELLQIPPVVALVSVVILPAQTDLVPSIATGAAGIGLTMNGIFVLLLQPFLFVTV